MHLLSIAHKHIDDYVQTISLWTIDEPDVEPTIMKDVASTVEILAGMAMNDFKRFRHASGSSAVQNEIANSSSV